MTPFHKTWLPQCRAAKVIRRRFGAKDALDYLVAEKLTHFAAEAERNPLFARELPRFLAAVWQIFNPYEIVGYIASLKPGPRMALRRLLYVR